MKFIPSPPLSLPPPTNVVGEREELKKEKEPDILDESIVAEKEEGEEETKEIKIDDTAPVEVMDVWDETKTEEAEEVDLPVDTELVVSIEKVEGCKDYAAMKPQKCWGLLRWNKEEAEVVRKDLQLDNYSTAQITANWEERVKYEDINTAKGLVEFKVEVEDEGFGDRIELPLGQASFSYPILNKKKNLGEKQETTLQLEDGKGG